MQKDAGVMHMPDNTPDPPVECCEKKEGKNPTSADKENFDRAVMEEEKDKLQDHYTDGKKSSEVAVMEEEKDHLQENEQETRQSQRIRNQGMGDLKIAHKAEALKQ